MITNNHSQKSPNVEKLDEMPDYETTNGVGGDLIPPNGNVFIPHSGTTDMNSEDILGN